MPAEFPGEKMIAQGLFLIAAVFGELEEDFAFEKFGEIRKWGADVCEIRPAGLGDDEAGEFAD